MRSPTVPVSSLIAVMAGTPMAVSTVTTKTAEAALALPAASLACAV